MPTQSIRLDHQINKDQKREFWNAHIHDQERSGITQRAYCKLHGLGFASFTRWRGLALKAQTATSCAANQPKPESAFLPVRVVQAMPANARLDERTVDLVLRNGLRIEGICENNISVVTALVSQL